VLEPNELDPALSASLPPAGRAARGPVLIVDDSLSVRIALGRYVEQLGSRAVTAATLEEALAFVNAGVSAVISDHLMFGGSGLELLRRVRRFDADVPFLLTSMLFPEGVREAAYEAGANLVVDKLVLVDELPELMIRWGLSS
jgi:CheY-like chemotaxis protein